MRLPVVCSIVVHFAVIAAAYRLPVAPVRSRSAIEFDIREHKVAAPAVASLTPPLPAAEQKKLAMASAPRPHRAVETVVAPPLQPMETAPPTATVDPNSSAATVPKRVGPVDLTLHGLPSSGEWATGAPVAVAATAKKGPWKMRGDAGDPILGKLAGEKKDDYPLESLGKNGYVYNGPSFSARIMPDGQVNFDDKSIRDFKGLSGGFDLTDLIMKGKKEDPYRHEKKKFLEATSAKRAEMARQVRDEQIRSSLEELPWRCDEIWRDHRRGPGERRNLLFALWKETADNDDGLGDAGEKARGVIEKFIQHYLPAGSVDQFSDEELARLNRRGGRKFDPYHAN